MIVITGATGRLGGLITERLLEKIPADGIGVSVREPERARVLADRGVRVRRGDFDDPESLQSAFEGAAQVLIVSSNARSSGGDTLAQHRTAIEAAKAVGVRRIVYTSHMAASDTSAFPPMHDHAATEAMLGQSGLAWTALRNGFYGESGLMMMDVALTSGVFEAPEDGPFSWTAHTDLAEAAALILSDEGRYEGATPPLTGSEALDFTNLIQTASSLLNRPIRRETITDEGLKAKLRARGTPDAVASIVLGLYLASRSGEFAAVDPTLERILGHPPVTMRELMAEKIGGG